MKRSAEKPPDGEERSVDVICGGLHGTLLVDKAKILCDGKELAPPEFERVAGRGTAKKWKESVKVLRADGTPGVKIGNWLKARGFQVGPVRGGAREFDDRSSSEPFDAASTAVLRRRVGRLPGDPTAGPLPKSLPTDWGNRTVIDLREATQEQLAELSQQSAANPLGAMLPVQPGVREDRIGRFSGFNPPISREPSQAAAPVAGPSREADKAPPPEPLTAKEALQKYLQGQHPPPWEQLGYKQQPVLGGKPLNLKTLWEEVESCGGPQTCTQAKQWARVANRCGVDLDVVTNGSYLIRKHYEKSLQALGEEQNIEDNGRAGAISSGDTSSDNSMGAPSTRS